MSFLRVKADKTAPLKKYRVEKIGGQNCEEVVSWRQGLDCAASRQMSASLIKLDFRPAFREASRQTYTKNSGISTTTFILSGKVPSLLLYFRFPSCFLFAVWYFSFLPIP
jgi:hypothetical protein